MTSVGNEFVIKIGQDGVWTSLVTFWRRLILAVTNIRILRGIPWKEELPQKGAAPSSHSLPDRVLAGKYASKGNVPLDAYKPTSKTTQQVLLPSLLRYPFGPF